jgi:hypothetical protein
MDANHAISRRALIASGACVAGMAAVGKCRADAPFFGGTGPRLPIFDVVPAMPERMPLRWRQRADAFDEFVLNPANRVLRKRPDGTHYFASALEGTGDGGLTTFAPILLGKILRGEMVDWLAPSIAAYFSDRYGIFLDGRRASSCEYWYLMNVNALAAGVVRSHWPKDPRWTARVRRSADRLISLAHQIQYDFSDQGYRFDASKPWTKQDIYRQPDAIGGYAYLQLLAYEMFGDAKYLAEAKEGLRRYLGFAQNPWYEVPSGAMACLAAARLSPADRGIDVAKALGFVLDPGGRPLQTGRWGKDEVGGLMAGFCTEPAGEAYSMESLVTAGYLLPVLRYRPELASVIGRYLLNASANMRLFYSDCIAAENQSRPELTSAVPYERLTSMWGAKSPYASGDYGSHRSIYGGAYALWWGELVKPTSNPRILRMSVAASDFLERKAFPTYLYYNPFAVAKSVNVSPMPEGTRLYDLGAHMFLHPRLPGDSLLEIPAREAKVIVLIPPGARPKFRNRTLSCGDIVVDYAAPGDERGSIAS